MERRSRGRKECACVAARGKAPGSDPLSETTDGAFAAHGIGLALCWHHIAFEDLLALVRRAEEAGFAAVFVDGDVSVIESRGEADVLDGWTLTTALLARTSRIAIGSIRLVHHWNAARLAQAVATQERMTPGRLRLLVSIGGQPADTRFGLPMPPPADRVAWLDETLTAVRQLWRGETVTMRGRFVHLDRARVRPLPRDGAMPIEVAGRGAQMLGVVARHADVWDMNLPPLPQPVASASAKLSAACAAAGRNPASIVRSMWILARPGLEPDEPALRSEFRRVAPWFRSVPDDEVAAAVIAGPAATCRERLLTLAARFGIARPVADLSGLDADAARRALDALAPR